MAENVGSIYYTVEADTSGLVNGTNAADRSLDQMQATMRRADSEAARLNTTVTKLSSAIKTIIAASALREMASMVQSYQEMADRVRLASASQEEYENVQARLLRTANGTYRALSEAQELYIRTSAGLKALGYDTTSALDVMDSLSYAFVTNATKADAAEAAISQFSKAINTGKVSADQWETISSAVPSVIEDIGAAAGKTGAEVRSLGAQGQLTAQMLTEGLRKSLEENSKAAAGMSNNLTDAGVRIRTAFTQVLVSLEDQTGALQTFTNGLISAADALLEFGLDSEKMAAFLDTATVAAASLASVVAGRLVTSLYAAGAAQVQRLRATLEQIAADRNAAIGALRRAEAEKAAAAAAVALAQADLNAARGSNAHATALNALLAAKERDLAATRALTAAQATLNGVATTGTVVMGGLRSAMAFLGGPLGVVLLAVTAIATFATNAREAKEPTDLLTLSVEKLGQAQLKVAQLDIDKRIQAVSDKLKLLGENYAFAAKEAQGSGRRANRYAEDAVRIQGAVEELTQELDQLQKKRSDVDAALDKKSSSPSGNGPDRQANPEDTKALQNLRDEAELSALAGEERAKLAARKKLSADATKEEIAEAERLAVQIFRNSEARKQEKKSASDTASTVKKSMEDQRRAALDNEKTIGDLSQQLAQAGLKGKELAEAGAQSRLNPFATPEQVAQVRALAAALYEAQQVEANKQLLGQMDPIAGEDQRYQTELENLKKLNEAKLLEDQRYLELKTQAEQQHDATMKQLEEERFRRQAAGNEMIMATLDQVQQAGTNALTGLITGANNGADAMRQLAGAMLNQVVGALVKVGIEQAKNFIMGQAQQAAAATTAAATGAAMASAYAPAAAAASVASFGGAATAGLTAMAAAIPAMLGMFAGGRQYGGPVGAGGMYRINENGAPEVFQAANGRQYMLPNTRGEVISNGDASAQGSPQISLQIINNGPPVSATSAMDGNNLRVTLDAVEQDFANKVSSGQGLYPKAIEGAYGFKRAGR
ncbi:TPA: tape measure protein [Pseudomonas aeruginosa]|nr:tape measure protein [Pseudomonas aeruginosa]HCE9310470.1 tape measure protein [Pseudomonas aeruginosa]